MVITSSSAGTFVMDWLSGWSYGVGNVLRVKLYWVIESHGDSSIFPVELGGDDGIRVGIVLLGARAPDDHIL